ncbi:mycofactocin oligosaccharide methyltransferase MftM [Lapillicoccus jejuensis]|uniref:Methyltransferase family protein n=1 Tax=Lapillicoccus jejuensis TaxID=402171 RepID=A0A542E3F9_9MICO|nr:mycofactocin oligosaccharide methyltransferase MftM [Lapillicoccus jejuensis]TQJ09865.1 methyltransferase family protein [Lapillicoccus jejuensis]
MTGLVAAPIDPLAPMRTPGEYEDALVVVRRRSGDGPAPASRVATEHFRVDTRDGRLTVTHRLRPDEVDDDLAGLLVDELFGPGWVRGPELFERLFTGVVRSLAPDPLDAWELFYRNTTARLEALRTARGTEVAAAHGCIAGYAPVYERAEALVPAGSVLELGSCFGFLSLRLAGLGHDVTASDVAAGTVRLLAAVAPRLGVRLTTVLADAARLPLDDGCADTVLAIHLLEHVDADHGAAVLHEAVRCARRRVVVAVPLEDEADESFGHVRTVDLDDLRAWGRASGLRYDVAEHHGGWLVLDR